VRILEYLGQDPQRSMKRFMIGLGFFICGLVFVYIGYVGSHEWQILGLALIGIGIALAVWGYLGIFANRLYHMLNRPPAKHND